MSQNYVTKIKCVCEEKNNFIDYNSYNEKNNNKNNNNNNNNSACLVKRLCEKHFDILMGLGLVHFHSS